MSSGMEPKANRLIHEISPYLKRLAHSPVDWYPWGSQAFERARSLQRPILLSIGYSASHWCARMDSETFGDPQVAEFLNDWFVCVKVDREERPDVDSYYMHVVRAMSGEAGYPLNVFLDPEGVAFYGSAYLPPTRGAAQLSFREVVHDLAFQWQNKREEVIASGRQVADDIERRDHEEPPSVNLDAGVLQQAVFSIQSAFDEEHGGLGEAPKFPQASALEFMLRGAARGVGKADKVAEVSLRAMARGGIYDQLGGGFHRYSLDRQWVVPEFEKMLYDNALLARLYTHAWQLRQDALFRRTGEETLEYLLRDLSDLRGAFYSSEGSNAGGRAGDFYVWDYDEFMAIAPKAAGYYGVTEQGNFHGKNVLVASADEPPGPERAALRKARAGRARPFRDEKIVASWNGLAISAFAEAGAAFNRLDLVEAARRCASFVLQFLRGSEGRLHHLYFEGQLGVPAMLEDYAYLADGLFTLWEVTFEPQWIEACSDLVDEMLALFWDDEGGGLFTTPGDQDHLIPRRKEYFDPFTPSATGVAALVLMKVAVLSGDEGYRKAGATILHAANAEIQGMFLDAASVLSAIDFYLTTPAAIIILGDETDSRTRALRREVWSRFLPNKVVAGAPPGVDCALLEGKKPVNGEPTAYVSHGALCHPPVNDPEELGRLVKFWRAPSDDQVSKVTGLMTNELRRRHFFENLESPSWIGPLHEAGFFGSPPETMHDFAQGTVASPPWAQSRYLARMAPISPEAVHQVAMEMDQGDNVVVHEDLADAALNLPPDLAADFVPLAKEWLKSPYQLHLPEKLGELIRRLAEGGRVQEALDLAVALLELSPKVEEGATELTAGSPEPASRFNRLSYEQILKEHIPALVEESNLGSVDLLSDLLDTSIRLSRPAGGDNPPEDDSHVWRPAIHHHELNIDKTLRDPLVSAATEAVEQIARADPSRVPELVEALERRNRHVFTRIALHLLRVWPERAPELVGAHLMNHDLFGDPHFHHEYLLLAREHFGELTEEQQSRLLGWIDEGPDVDLWRSDAGFPQSDEPSGEELERYRRGWKLKRLLILEEHLPPDYRKKLEELIEEFGRPDHPEFVSYSEERRTDPTTPKQADELHEMTVDDLVAFLHSWKPSPGLGNPTPEGLARRLAAVVASEPGRFAMSADRFVGLDPRYVWAVLQGLREAAEGYTLDWPPILKLCRWASEKHRGEDPRDWAPARVEAARVLAAGFTHEAAATIPFRLRSEAWEALRSLPDHPDLDVTHAGGSRPGIMSGQPSGSTRAEALQAVVRYALWVRRYLETTPNARERVARGFKEMPEVRAVLDAHLDPQANPRIATHAVYGQWFPWLLLMDGHWTMQRVRKVFPDDPALAPLRRAAWDAYIGSSPPFDQLLQVLESEYERAVDELQSGEPQVRARLDPRHRLAEHVMAFFFRGKLRTEDPNGLLVRFFGKAPDEVRAYAVGFVGRTIHGQTGHLPKVFLDKLQRFWDWRFAQIREEAANSRLELGAFGWWFASGKFDDSWAVERLVAALELGARVEPAKQVVGRLADLVLDFPQQSVRCLALLLKAEKDSPNLASWTEEARKLLNRAVQTGDPSARREALELLEFFDVSGLEELVRWH
ncbi:MAG: thioredoxin domain-containing protein [Actinomycetota bacterium]|nr:thioredoxin domain-containing protein [Actinomycetota bacterium]